VTSSLLSENIPNVCANLYIEPDWVVFQFFAKATPSDYWWGTQFQYLFYRASHFYERKDWATVFSYSISLN